MNNGYARCRGAVTVPALFVVALVASSCGNSPVGPDTQNQAPTVAAVVVTSSIGPLIATGKTAQLSAAATDPAGAAVTGLTVAWQTSDSTVATVNAAGTVAALAAGQTTITASAGGKSGTIALTVADADLAGIAMSVGDPVVPALVGDLSSAAAAAASGALADCTDGAQSGNLTGIQHCIATVRAAAQSAAGADDAVLLAALSIIVDHVERLLNL
jgi:Bacterial Ig-like domain (group 2)